MLALSAFLLGAFILHSVTRDIDDDDDKDDHGGGGGSGERKAPAKE